MNALKSARKMADHKVSSNVAKLPALSVSQRTKKRNKDSLVSQSSSSRSSRLPPAFPRRPPSNLSRRKYNTADIKSSVYNDARGTLESPSPHERGATEGGREASALQRFKTLANKVKNQIVWTKGLQRAEEHLKMTVVPGQDGTHSETLTFNVNAFKPEIQSWEGLSPKAKTILVKPSWL